MGKNNYINESKTYNQKNETLRIRKDSVHYSKDHRFPIHTTGQRDDLKAQNIALDTIQGCVIQNYKNLQQGDIIGVDLGEGEGSEESGIHPCYVLLNNLGIIHGPTLVIAPISSSIKKLPTHYTIYDYQKYGLSRVSQILFEQQRTVDKSRIKYGVIGHIDCEVIMNELLMTYGFSIKTEKKEDKPNDLRICRAIG